MENRISNEDKIPTNAIEVCSEVTRMSSQMEEEVVCIKSRHQGSAANTVSGSAGSGGSVGNFAARAAQNTFSWPSE